MISLKNQYLREMGVDVWVPRTRNPLIPRPVKTGQAVTPEERAIPATETPEPRPAAKAAAPAADPFHLCFITYRDMSLVFSVPVGVTSLPESLRRFADDIALACLVDRPEPVIANLRWPMVQSTHIDQSDEAATAVVAQRLGKCGRRVLLFGDKAASYEKHCRGETLKLDEIESYQAVPLSKRELWQTLQAFRKTGSK